ncbi:MAG: D-alanyl-D-alanine carboxypeptidase, partial [Ruminiclostridium sp.]|nr:D-alanyl-D-alanine carboxypeptidase [Ruminiclostridium sp.]
MYLRRNQMIKRKMLAVVIILVILHANPGVAFSETTIQDTAMPPDLKSESAVLMDQKTGKILYEKDSHKKVYPASLTKILTGLLILENIDAKETVTVGKEIQLIEQDASEAGLFEGEKLSGSDLMWALMLPSGNDAAYTAAVYIARKVSGNTSMDIPDAVKYFSGMMDNRARKIGANESNFVNPDGYPDENHYTTAYDMALISMETLKNDFFREVVNTYTYVKGGKADPKLSTESKKAPVIWYNKNQLINKKSKYFYEYAKGIKTGHTEAAGYCLSAYAEKDGRVFVSIILKADSEEARWLDTKALLEYGFNNFKYHTFVKKGESVSNVSVVRKYFGDSVDINILAGSEYTDILTDKDFAGIKRTIEWDKSLLIPGGGETARIKLAGPVSSGQIVGKVSYTLNGKVLSEASLLASSDALKGDFKDKIV